MKPPGVRDKFEECSPWIQAMLISFNQIRCYEEMEMAAIGVPRQL